MYRLTHLHPFLKNFSWIILSLCLRCNRTVWHVLVNKTIVFWIINDTTVCVNRIWSFNFFHYFFHLFLSILKNSLETLLNIKWRQMICCVITNWRENVHHGISQLIQYFFNWIVFTTSFFLWKYIFSILFVLETPSDLGVHLEFPLK